MLSLPSTSCCMACRRAQQLAHCHLLHTPFLWEESSPNTDYHITCMQMISSFTSALIHPILHQSRRLLQLSLSASTRSDHGWLPICSSWTMIRLSFSLPHLLTISSSYHLSLYKSDLISSTHQRQYVISESSSILTWLWPPKYQLSVAAWICTSGTSPVSVATWTLKPVTT